MKDFCVEKVTAQTVELKVCEGCGSLWLRAAGKGCYCRSCADWLREFPAPRGRRPVGRRRSTHAVAAPAVRSRTRLSVVAGQAVCAGGAR